MKTIKSWGTEWGPPFAVLVAMILYVCGVIAIAYVVYQFVSKYW